MHRALIAALLLVACGGHPAPVPPPGGGGDEPPHQPYYAIATPTADPVPDIDHLYAKLMTDTYAVFIFDDGMVAWYGGAGVKAVGERHARLIDETYQAIREAFADAKFASLTTPEDPCDEPYTVLELYAGDDSNSIDYRACQADPVIEHLIERIDALVGVDQFIHGNPDAPGGPLPDGEHLVVDYQRTVCFGACPTYEILLFDDGTVVWTGEENVAKPGELRAHVPAEAVQAVIDAFEPAFLDLDDAATMQCTDTPHTIVTFQRGDRHRRDDPHCEELGVLGLLEDRFEELVIGDEGWIREPVQIVELAAANCVAGTCPEYTASLWSNRRVRWNGAGHVAVTGEQVAWVPAATFYALEAALGEAQFFSADEAPIKTKRKCGQRYKLTIQWDDQQKTVDDDGCGDRPRLRKLEQAVVEELRIGAWIK